MEGFHRRPRVDFSSEDGRDENGENGLRSMEVGVDHAQGEEGGGLATTSRSSSPNSRSRTAASRASSLAARPGSR